MLDLLIKNAILLTMEGNGVGLIPDGAVGIEKDKIKCVDHATLVTKSYSAKQEIDARGKIVLPGFVDAHCHSYYGVLCKGVLTDLEYFLEQGLAGYIDTLTIENMSVACKAHLLEGVKHGMTTFCDMGEHYDILSQAHETFGVRARISTMIRELPWNMVDFLEGEYKFERKYAQEGINTTRKMLDKFGTDSNERISTMVGFQALDYVSEELLLELIALAKKHKAMVHTHMSQSPYEIRQVEKRFGLRPVDVFEKYGLLNENTLAAHLVYNNKKENKKAARSGMRMVACPVSWGEVGIVPPVAQYLHFGGTIGIGSDEAAYTGINPVAIMKAAHASANVDAFQNNTPNVSLSTILKMQTIGSAKAIGMEQQIGSLKPGKKADIIILNPEAIAMRPVLVHPLTNIPQNIVCAATGTEVETVIIDGKIIMENHAVKVVNEEVLLKQIQETADEAACLAAGYYSKLPESEIMDRQRRFGYTINKSGSLDFDSGHAAGSADPCIVGKYDRYL